MFEMSYRELYKIMDCLLAVWDTHTEIVHSFVTVQDCPDARI